jgi:hypothetical protein
MRMKWAKVHTEPCIPPTAASTSSSACVRHIRTQSKTRDPRTPSHIETKIKKKNRSCCRKNTTCQIVLEHLLRSISIEEADKVIKELPSEKAQTEWFHRGILPSLEHQGYNTNCSRAQKQIESFQSLFLKQV